MSQAVLPCILSISGIELSSAEANLFKRFVPYGVCLFKRNILSASQLKLLTADLRKICPDIMICIDEEGGRVSRLVKAGIIEKASFPSADYFYQIAIAQGLDVAKCQVEENYRCVGLVMKGLGIDINFAPVADLRHQNGHSVIGERSFGYDSVIVQELCKSSLHGLSSAGIRGCIKHIPGHGRSVDDTHVSSSIIDAKLSDLEDTDFAVFKFLSDYAEFAMTAHIIYDSLDPHNPVTTSSIVVNYIRKQIGFKGILISDAIEMEAMGSDLESVVLRALSAGVDMPLYCAGKIDELQLVCRAVTEWVKKSGKYQ